MWGGGGEPCRHPFIARMSQARRKHGAGTRRGTCPSAGGGACLVAPVVALPTLRSHPRWSPRWGLHGACSLRARSCGPARTLSPVPPHPAALSSGGGGGALFAPPYLHPPPLGGRRCGGGGAPLSSSLRSTHVAGTTQAWRRHEARHLSLCRGGGGLAVCHPSSPLLPCVRTPGGAEVCVWGGGGLSSSLRCTHVAGTRQARRKHGLRHLAEVIVGSRTRTAHGTTHGNYPLPCPLCSLPRPVCSLGAEQSPCLPRRSLSLPRLSGLCSPPKCPTSFPLPVPPSLVLAGPRCMTLRRHTGHCTFGGGLPCGSTPRHPAFHSAPARCGRLARLWGTLLPPSLPCHLRPSALRPVRAQCGAIREAALPLCPPLYPGPLALFCLLSTRPRSPCPAPRPWLQGLRPPVSLSPSSLYPLGVHRAEQCARQPSHSLSPLLPPGVLSSWYVARTLYRTRYLRGQAA